jgi:hypothetical protein
MLKACKYVSGPALRPDRSPIQYVYGIMRQEPEANLSPPSSAEVKNDGAIPPLPHKFSWRGA